MTTTLTDWDIQPGHAAQTFAIQSGRLRCTKKAGTPMTVRYKPGWQVIAGKQYRLKYDFEILKQGPAEQLAIYPWYPARIHLADQQAPGIRNMDRMFTASTTEKLTLVFSAWIDGTDFYLDNVSLAEVGASVPVPTPTPTPTPTPSPTPTPTPSPTPVASGTLDVPATAFSHIPAVATLLQTKPSAIFMLPWYTKHVPAPAPQAEGVYLDEEFAGPYTGWRNVKTLHGAVGDGVADDTAAFQAAFDALSNNNSTCPVMYIPAGTYKITGTISRNQRRGLTILGEDPATTTLKWAGSAGGTMVAFQGTQHLRFGRLTLDGSSTCGRLLHIWKQTSDGASYFFPKFLLIEDIHFKDSEFGFSMGKHSTSTANSHGGNADTNVKRCKFTGCTVSAVQVTDFNTLNDYFYRCLFDGNAIGITDTIGYPQTGNGAGNWQVWDCEFKNHSGPAMKCIASQFYFYNVRSRNNAGGLLESISHSSPCQIWMHGCFDDGTATDPVKMLNLGAMAVIDCRFQKNGRSLYATHASGRIIAVGNKVGNTGTWATVSGSLHEQNTTTFDSAPAELTFAFAPKVTRSVYEVTTVTAANIQTAINSAVAAGNRAKVHIPYGMHSVATGVITIPKNTDIEITGDGSTLWDNGTFLLASAASASPVITIERPTKATIRDMGIDGQAWANCLLTNSGSSDTQVAGGRITMEQMQFDSAIVGAPYAMKIEGDLKVDLLQMPAVMELGGSGELLDPAIEATGPLKLNIWGALTINFLNGFKLTNVDLIMAGFWYENTATSFIDFPRVAGSGSTGSGTISIVGASLATNASPYVLVDVSRFTGDVLLGCNYMSGKIQAVGSASTRLLCAGIDTGEDIHTITASASATLATLQCRKAVYESNTVIADSNISEALVTSMMSNIRSQSIDQLNVAKGANVTDLRIHNIWVKQGISYNVKHQT